MSTTLTDPRQTVELAYDLARFWLSPFGMRFGVYFQESVEKGSSNLRDPSTLLAVQQAVFLSVGSNYYVADNMCEVAAEAAHSFPDDLTLEGYMLPARNGFVVLETPIEIMDINRITFSVQAFMWTSGGTFDKNGNPNDDGPIEGVRVFFYNPINEEVDTTQEAIKELRDEFGLASIPPIWLLHYTDYMVGDQILKKRLDVWTEQVRAKYKHADDDTIARVTEAHYNTSRFICALWSLINQVVERKSHKTLDPDRATRRRLARDKNPVLRHFNGSRVELVTLRRASPDGTHEPQQVDWKHRWVVRGHWHRYHYANGETRMRWIEDYEKGPQSAPLLMKDRVYFLKR